MQITLRSDHRVNGVLYPRGQNFIENEDLARALLFADGRATPEVSFKIGEPQIEHAPELPPYIKLPSSGADPEVK